MNRCAWSSSNPLMIEYHDTEWGVPLHDDRKLFEFLILEGMQAGLSWSTILNKRVSQLSTGCDFLGMAAAVTSDGTSAESQATKGFAHESLRMG